MNELFKAATSRPSIRAFRWQSEQPRDEAGRFASPDEAGQEAPAGDADGGARGPRETPEPTLGDRLVGSVMQSQDEREQYAIHAMRVRLKAQG
jgi:hypothetical protein